MLTDGMAVRLRAAGDLDGLFAGTRVDDVGDGVAGAYVAHLIERDNLARDRLQIIHENSSG